MYATSTSQSVRTAMDRMVTAARSASLHPRVWRTFGPCGDVAAFEIASIDSLHGAAAA